MKTVKVEFTRKELEYILESLKSDQEDLSYHGATYDFLNHLIDKLDDVLYRNNLDNLVL